jgi:hypothetical protein
MRIRYGEVAVEEDVDKAPTFAMNRVIVSPSSSPTTADEIEGNGEVVKGEKETQRSVKGKKRYTESKRGKEHESVTKGKSRKKDKRRKRDTRSCNSSRASSSRLTRTTVTDDESITGPAVSCHDGIRIMLNKIIQSRCGGLDDTMSLYDTSDEEDSDNESFETDDVETEYDESVREPKREPKKREERVVSFDDESDVDEERRRRFLEHKQKQKSRQSASDESLSQPVELKMSPPRKDPKNLEPATKKSVPTGDRLRDPSPPVLLSKEEDRGKSSKKPVRKPSPLRQPPQQSSEKNLIDLRHMDRKKATFTTTQRLKSYSFLENVDLHDRNFIKAFVSALTTSGLPLLLHSPSRSRNQVFTPGRLVTAFLRTGVERSSGQFTEPRLAWETEDRTRKNSVDLFDIRSLEKASTADLENYPLAMAGRSVTLHTFRSSNFVFEAPNEDIALRFVHGMRWVVARLAFNLIIGNVNVSCELLEYDGIGTDVPKDRKDLAQINAMNDVANHLVEKTYKNL